MLSWLHGCCCRPQGRTLQPKPSLQSKSYAPQASPNTTADEATKVSGAACTADRETCLLAVGDEYRYALTFEIVGDHLALKDHTFVVPMEDKNGKKIKEADTEGISFSDGIFLSLSALMAATRRVKRGCPVLRIPHPGKSTEGRRFGGRKMPSPTRWTSAAGSKKSSSKRRH